MFKPQNRRGASPISRLISTLLVVVLAWGAGLVYFADTIPLSTLEGAVESDVKSDAIVVLTGGSGRLDEGLRLLNDGFAEKLFISGVYKGVDMKYLLEAYRQNPEELNCCVDIGHAEDTINNALETAEWAAKNNVISLHLVTSAYHMPRAVLEFRHAMPAVALHQHPVFPPHVKQRNWWAWPGTTGLIVGEYNKFLMAWVRHRVIGLLNA